MKLQARPHFVAGAFRRPAALFLLFLTVCTIFPSRVAGEHKFEFAPRFRPGQTFEYTTNARIKRRTKTESNVVSPAGAVQSQNEIFTTVRVAIRDVKFVNGRQVITAHAEIDTAPAPPVTPPPENVKSAIDFTIGGDGQVLKADGLDDLATEPRIAWQYWISQFAYGATLPTKGVAPGDKWKTDEAERTPAPIAGLVWDRETTYVQNDTCPVIASEQCAVFLIKATLKQKSSEENATPSEYALRHLKTSGTAKGANETIIYVSLKTNLVMRGKEDVNQSMDATIAKEDDSNQVRYLIETNSQFETLFVPPSLAPSK